MRKLIILIILLFINLPVYANVNYIEISTSPQAVEFHIEDAGGNICGYTPNGILRQIPNLDYTKDTAITNPEPATEKDKFNAMTVMRIPAQVNTGKYKFVIYGATTPTITRIAMDLDWTDNPKWDAKYFKYPLIYPNVVWIYEFDVSAVAPSNKQIILTKVSTPTDLIKDITIAGQLGYIGNPHFISETIEKINEIEKERTKPAEKDDDHKLTPAQKAKREYTELLSEITEKYNKPEGDEFVKQEAYTVLKEDIEYIIGHL